MSNNKSSFRLIYYLHVIPNNHHVFITTGAHIILLNMDLPLGQSIFTEITYTKPFIFQNKLISTRESLWQHIASINLS